MTDQPTHTDVLLGRGVATTRHPGNRRFRSIVSEHLTLYATSTKKQKMMISRSIVDRIREEGEFLEKRAGTSSWHAVDDRRALEKTAQALRDGAAPIRKRLTENLGDPAFLDAVFDETDAPAAKSSLGRRPPPGKGGKSSLTRSHMHKQGKKHRRTKSAPLTMKVKDALTPDRVNLVNPLPLEQSANLEDESCTSAPIREVVCITEIESTPFSSYHQPQGSAEEQHLVHSPHEMSQNQLSFTDMKPVVYDNPPTEVTFSHDLPLDGDTVISINEIIPPSEVAFSRALTLDAPDDDDYAPLPLISVHGERDMTISINDILRAVEILSDTGIQPTPTVCRPMTMYQEPVQSRSLSNDHYLKVTMDDDWQGVLGDWHLETAHDS